MRRFTERRLIKTKMINFKKIASILASGVMLASTISFAAATNLYPKPFAADNTAIVYGANAQSSDMAGAIDIYSQLKNMAVATTTESISGETKAIETASQQLYLGDYLNSTKSIFSKDQLPSVLASGVLTDDDGNELDYDLKIAVPNTYVTYSDTADNLDLPVINLNLDNSNYYYTLKVIFPTAVDMSKLAGETIKLFGKEYSFSESESDLTKTKIVLFETAIPIIVNDGENIVAEGHTITVAIEDSETASISIDGETESRKEGWSGKINGVDIYVKNVVGPNVAGTKRFVEIYLNSNKLTLENDNEVLLGSTNIDGTDVTLVTSGDKVSEIKIDINPKRFDDSIEYLKMGDSMVDPVFKTIKMSLESVNPELESTLRDDILIKPSGERTVSIEFTNKAGKSYDMNFLKPSNTNMDSNYATHEAEEDDLIYKSTILGVGDYDLIASPSGNISEDDYFITCSNEYTQIWRLENIKATTTTKEIKVKDQGSDSELVTISLNDGLSGSLTLADGSASTLTLNPTNTSISVNKACNYLYTKNGAKIDLSKANDYNGTLSSQVIIEEKTSYNGGEFKSNNGNILGENIVLQFAYNRDSRSGKDMELKSIIPGGSLNTDYWAEEDGDDKYSLTKYGTYMMQTGDTDKQIELWYPEKAMNINFYIGEVSSEITPGSTGTAGGQITIIKDSEISTIANKNLIVVGGSCVNTVAAKILGSNAPLCGADFTDLTDVSSGGYIIKTVDASKAGGTAGKVAMLVAGYNAADTTNAIKRAMVINGVTTDINSEEIFPAVV